LGNFWYNSPTMNKKYLGTVGVLVLILLGVFAYASHTKTTDNKGQKSTSTEIATTTQEAVVESTLPNISVPNVNRAIPETTSLSVMDKETIVKKIQTISSALKQNPDSLENWLNLGLYRKSLGDYEGARLAWEYANALRPKNYVSFSNLGDLFQFYVHDYKAAEKNLLQAVTNEPAYITGYKNLYDLYSLPEISKKESIPALLDRGLHSNPHNIDLLMLYGEYEKSVGNKAQASTRFNEAKTEVVKSGNKELVNYLNTIIANL
jgi:hypothetical protein